jgi:SAM-dependent methyltransferase
MNDSNQDWTNFNAEKSKGDYPTWPIEAMVKVLFGGYLKGPKPTFDASTKVLDIGCGFGNNLLPFLVRGCDCYGVEITDDMSNLAQEILRNRGFENIHTKTGSNQSLPFDDQEMDLIISNNVIHYEKNEESYLTALQEYARVLKSGGGLYLMTAGPEHDIYVNAEVVGPHQFQIQNWDFRDGEQYFYLSDLKYLNFYLSKFFEDIELGQVTEKLMQINLDFYVSYCRKPEN